MVTMLIAAVLLAAPIPSDKGSSASGAAEMLHNFAEAYSETSPSDTALVVQLNISPPGDSWCVSIQANGVVDLREGKHETPAMSITMSEETLARIHQGDMTAFTAGAKGTGADSAPLELEFHAPAERLSDPKGTMLAFIQHFFVRERPERILLGEEHSRIVHGAHSIPLYYASGFRSAWYKVKDGQRLNEPGDVNPFPQAFIIVSGKGRAKIGDSEISVRAGESYFIPPGADHVLWSEPGGSLEVVWLAWGEGA
jgi:mannose-6-phosphate isomerase-like protein (cupin superfamily)